MQIRPYGDTANDGVVQLSFTLPLPLDARAREQAVNPSQAFIGEPLYVVAALVCWCKSNNICESVTS